MAEAFQISFSIDAISQAAQQFLSWAKDARVIAFSGGLGAGKTTFIHALCANLGVSDAVSSPTFALINEYRFPKSDGGEGIICHMDWYRLNSLDEAIDAGMEDALQNQDTLCLIEWPERAAALLRLQHVQVQLSVQTNDLRLLKAQVVAEAQL